MLRIQPKTYFSQRIAQRTTFTCSKLFIRVPRKSFQLLNIMIRQIRKNYKHCIINYN